MNPAEKVVYFLRIKKMTQIKFAKQIGVDYQKMNKNLNNGKLTIEVALGIARLFSDIDMNWVMRNDE